MKMKNRFLSIFTALALTSQAGIMTPPVMAEETETPVKLGLILDLDGSSTDGWTLGEGAAEGCAITSEDGYVKLTTAGTYDNQTNAPYMYAELPDGGIKFEEDKTIVIDTRVTGSDMDAGTNGRLQLKWNIPEKMTQAVALRYNGTEDLTTKQETNTSIKGDAENGFTTAYGVGSNHLVLADFLDSGIRVPNGIQSSASLCNQTSWASAFGELKGKLTDNWYRVVFYMKPGYKMVYKVYDSENTLVGERTGTLGWVDQSETFKNFAVQSAITMLNYAKVDYLKVYNLPTENADNFADYETSFDEVTVSDIMVDGVAIDEVKEATNGTVTFTANGEVSVKNITYTERTGDKETFQVENYVYENNTITFPDGLANKATYTVVLDLGNGITDSFSFNGPWKDQVGLLYSQEAETATDWILGASITKAEESSEGYQKYLPTTKDIDSTLKIPMGDNKIKFEDDKVIVIETKVKGIKNPDKDNSRLSLVYNAGITVEDSDNATAIANNKTTLAYQVGANHGVLIQLYEKNTASTFDIGCANGSYSSSSTLYTQTALGWVGGLKANTLDGTNEYTLIAKLNKLANTAEITVKKDGTKIAEKSVTDLGWITTSDYLENVSFNSVVNPLESFEVDYVKVYNLPVDCATNIKVDGVAIDDVFEATNGTVTFDSEGDVTVKEVYYEKDGEKVNVADTEYSLSNNTVTFNNALVKNAKYYVTFDLYNLIQKTVSFDSEWENPTGLVLGYEGTSDDAWTSATGATVAISQGTDEDGTTYTKMVPSAANAYMYATLPGEGIKYKEGEKIVIDTRVRADNMTSSNDARLQIKWNLPASSATSFMLKYIGTNDLTGQNAKIFGDLETGFTAKYENGGNHLALGEIAHTWSRFSVGNQAAAKDSWQNRFNSYSINEGTQQKWYRIVMEMDYGFSMKYKLYDAAGNLLFETAGNPTWVEQSKFLKNIAVFSFQKAFNSADVDYLKIYNLPSGDGITNIKVDGVAIEERAEATEGTVTFDSIVPTTVKEVYYVKDDVKTAVTDYGFENNTVTFNGLEDKAQYTIVLDLGYTTYEINFSSPYVQPTGLIFENDGTDGWNEGYDFINNETQKVDISYEEEDGKSYMHFVPSGTIENVTSYLASPMAYMSLGENKIKFRKGYTVVTEMMVRTTSTDATSGRPRISYSFPEDSSLAGFTYVNDQSLGVTEQPTQTKYQANMCLETLVEFLNSNVRFGVGTYPSGDVDVSNDKWYKLVMMIDGNYVAKYLVIDPEDGSVVGEYAGQMQIMRKSGFFENVALYTWMHSKSLTEAYTDVDYVKVYNMPSAYADEYYLYDDIVAEEDMAGEKTNGVITVTDMTEETVKNITITNRHDEDIDFVATLNNGVATLRVKKPLEGDRYLVAVNGEVYNKYDVENVYKAELTLGGFTTDIPEVFAAEGVKFYKAQYNGTALSAVESIPVTGAKTLATLGDENAKVFLWNSANQPVKTYKDTYVVGFIGGSLTEQGALWRDEVKEILEENITDKEIVTYAAGKGGTPSSYGSQRFDQDIAKYNPDLVFIEFAVNDSGNTKEYHTTYMENMVRQCLELENVPDVVFLYTPMPAGKDTERYQTWKEGVDWKEELANHYGIKSINIYDYIYNEWEVSYKEAYPVFEDYLTTELGYQVKNDTIDVHAGFEKYAEAIRAAYEEDYASCFTTPKNPEYYSMNTKNVNARYNHIPVTSDNVTATGWTLTTAENKGSTSNYHFLYPYFTEGILEDTVGGAEVTVTSDADVIAICFPGSTHGNELVTCYVDGVEANTFNVSSAYDNVINCKWVTLPGDGEVHTVKFVTGDVTEDNYLSRIGEFIECYY